MLRHVRIRVATGGAVILMLAMSGCKKEEGETPEKSTAKSPATALEQAEQEAAVPAWKTVTGPGNARIGGGEAFRFATCRVTVAPKERTVIVQASQELGTDGYELFLTAPLGDIKYERPASLLGKTFNIASQTEPEKAVLQAPGRRERYVARPGGTLTFIRYGEGAINGMFDVPCDVRTDGAEPSGEDVGTTGAEDEGIMVGGSFMSAVKVEE